MSDANASNPCITCGACCAFFRASFYWAEADEQMGGTVPTHLTEPLTPHLVAMKGTTGSTPRCTCLQGTIGEQVHCTIYPQRSSTCREFPFSGENGQPNERCDKARAAWGLPPLLANSAVEPDRPAPTHAA